MRGNTAALDKLVQRLRGIPGMKAGMIAEAVPTVQKLLHNPVGTVPPRHVNDDARRYVVTDADQARIDGNTIVRTSGDSLAVGTGGGNPHDRPMVPVGDDELPMKWRRAISAKINGAIRRHLKDTGGKP